MKMKFIFFLIIAAAFFLRVYRIDTVPVSVAWDEAAIGYNAYSIIKTGMDEYGNRYPILFKSFSDYKLPGYIYSVAVSETVFGLTSFAVRLPSALYGTFTVIAFFFLVCELMKNLNNKILSPIAPWTPYFAAGLLAISPWHLQFSRTGYEANGQLFFITAGMLFLIKAVRKPFCFSIAAVFFGVSFYFYYTTRIITPLVGLLVMIVFWQEVKRSLKYISVAIIIFLTIIGPLVPQFFGSSSERGEQVAIYNDKAVNFPFSQAMARSPGSIIAKIVYNRRFVFFNSFLENYFRNNSLEYLFVSGDLYSRHDIIGMGVMYLWELPFVMIGIYKTATWKDKRKWLLIGWWFFGGVPASLTTGAPHALRTLSTAPVFIVFSALGVTQVFVYLHGTFGTKIRIAGTVGLGIIVLAFFVQYCYFYYDLSANAYATDWGDGHRQLVEYVKSIEPHYDKIYVTGRYFKPYIYFLFYSRYDPATYLAEKGTDKGFGKYTFYPADWESQGQSLEDVNFAKLAISPKSLYVFPSGFAKKTLQTIKEINSINGKSVFVLQSVTAYE